MATWEVEVPTGSSSTTALRLWKGSFESSTSFIITYISPARQSSQSPVDKDFQCLKRVENVCSKVSQLALRFFFESIIVFACFLGVTVLGMPHLTQVLVPVQLVGGKRRASVQRRNDLQQLLFPFSGIHTSSVIPLWELGIIRLFTSMTFRIVHDGKIITSHIHTYGISVRGSLRR